MFATKLDTNTSLTLVLILGCAWGCAAAPARSPAGAVARSSEGTGGGDLVGRPLPELSLPMLTGGEPLALRSLRGQVVLLDLWASWCAPCREEMPLLDDLARRLEAKGVRVVAVSVDEDRSAALEFLHIQPSWQLRVAHDANQDAASALHPPKMPTSYVIDRAGTLRHVHAGFERGDATRIESELVALAEQPSP